MTQADLSIPSQLNPLYNYLWSNFFPLSNPFLFLLGLDHYNLLLIPVQFVNFTVKQFLLLFFLFHNFYCLIFSLSFFIFITYSNMTVQVKSSTKIFYPLRILEFLPFLFIYFFFINFLVKIFNSCL